MRTCVHCVVHESTGVSVTWRVRANNMVGLVQGKGAHLQDGKRLPLLTQWKQCCCQRRSQHRVGLASQGHVRELYRQAADFNPMPCISMPPTLATSWPYLP